MNKLDLIIDALEEVISEPHWYDVDCIERGLAAARELRDMKPLAWWERDADTNNWFLTTSFNECAETEPLFALGDTDETNTK